MSNVCIELFTFERGSGGYTGSGCADRDLSVLFVEGPDGHRGHEARTSEEADVRDQQAALRRLAARRQAGETHVFFAQVPQAAKCGPLCRSF